VVWIPKYRKKVLYGELRKYLGEAIRDLAQQKESKVWEGHLMTDYHPRFHYPNGSYVVSIILLRVLCCEYLIHMVQEKLFMIHVILFIPSGSYNSIFIS
jgi:putative transposase